MTRTNLPAVPDLELPAARTVSMPFAGEPEPPAVDLELDVAHGATPSVPAMATCERCGAPLPLHARKCAYCATAQATRTRIPIAAVPPLAPSSYAPPPPFESMPVTRTDRLVDAIATIPYDFWKRVALYPFLAILLGNGCTCRGLSAATNVALVVLGVMGIVGVVACVRAQRSW